MALPWPTVLVPSSESWRLEGGSRSGGRSLTGAEQVVVGPSARWRATLTIPVHTPAKVLAFRALLAALDGRAGTVLVGPIEVTRAPWFIDPLTGGRITYRRGARDAAIDPAYDTNPDTSADLDFRVSGAAALNATALTIQRVRGGLLLPGMKFSIADRMHVITALTTLDPADPATGLAVPGTIGIQFRPWLRAAAPAGGLIEFGTPRCVMRLASDDTGALELQLSRYGSVTLDLVEA